MQVVHPIYGPGVVVRAAQGVFAYVQFVRPTNLPSALGAEHPNCLAVSLRVCS